MTTAQFSLCETLQYGYGYCAVEAVMGCGSLVPGDRFMGTRMFGGPCGPPSVTFLWLLWFLAHGHRIAVTDRNLHLQHWHVD